MIRAKNVTNRLITFHEARKDLSWIRTAGGSKRLIAFVVCEASSNGLVRVTCTMKPIISINKLQLLD